mmetsp:Transcript_49432/g.98468  ORF Transcript_49432/g.98468 Transcript_49432/m.98468 type:complete len:147 (-) Transcript_49432:46-486(-)
MNGDEKRETCLQGKEDCSPWLCCGKLATAWQRRYQPGALDVPSASIVGGQPAEWQGTIGMAPCRIAHQDLARWVMLWSCSRPCHAMLLPRSPLRCAVPFPRPERLSVWDVAHILVLSIPLASTLCVVGCASMVLLMLGTESLNGFS